MKPEDILLSETDFDAFVASQIDMLKRRLDDKPKSIMPHLAIKTVDMEGKESLTLCAIAMDFNEHAEKRALLMGLGRKMYEDKQIPLAAALSCEGWLAQNAPPGTQPRDCANKREVVLVVAADLGNKHVKMTSIPVKRDYRNRMQAMEGSGYDGEPAKVQSPILDHFFRGFAEAAMSPPPNNASETGVR